MHSAQLRQLPVALGEQSIALLEAVRKLLQNPVHLAHPVAAGGHRQPESPNVGTADRPVVGQFDGNTNEGAMGQVATHAYAQTNLIREQNQMMGKLVGGMWHPGAAYAGTQLGAAGIGSGF